MATRAREPAESSQSPEFAVSTSREAIAERFGSVELGAAAGRKLRHDGGSCFRSAHYQAELDHFAIERSLAFHYAPETNGVVEKFIQTLKEQVLWIERLTRSPSSAPASANSPTTTTSTGYSNATATAHPARLARRSVRPP